MEPTRFRWKRLRHIAFAYVEVLGTRALEWGNGRHAEFRTWDFRLDGTTSQTSVQRSQDWSSLATGEGRTEAYREFLIPIGCAQGYVTKGK